MTKEDALAWGNAELDKLHLSGMMRFRSGHHAGDLTCVDLITTDGYPDFHVEGILLDHEFAETYRAAVGRILLRVRIGEKRSERDAKKAERSANRPRTV